MSKRHVLLLLGALVAVSCTQGLDGPSPTEAHPTTPTTIATPPATTPPPVGEGVAAFEECLSDQGITVAEIPSDATGRPRLDQVDSDIDLTDPAVAHSVAICTPALGAGALDLSAEALLREIIVGKLNAFASCVRDMGVEDFPDPLPGFAGVGSAFSVAEIPYSDPLLGQATSICRGRLLSG